MRKKTVFIGSVVSSKIALEALIENNIDIDLVCSLDEEASKNVSDYHPIHKFAEEKSIPFIKFKKINTKEVVEKIRMINPDFIFVIGLSQIISKDILEMAKEYCIGFHPTPLPKYRGRAALPWQILLGVKESKVSLFKLDEGMDSGDIIIQYPYLIEESDYASDVYEKVCIAMKNALNKCLIQIYSDTIEFKKQNNNEATYLLIRRPEDGRIDWSMPGKEIETLIRAASRPYPGAYSKYKGKKVIFWRAYLKENKNYIGIPGQLASIDKEGQLLIVTKDGLLVVTDYITEDNSLGFNIGNKFS